MPAPVVVAWLAAGSALDASVGSSEAGASAVASATWVGAALPSETGAGPAGRKNRYHSPTPASASAMIATTAKMGPRREGAGVLVMNGPQAGAMGRGRRDPPNVDQSTGTR